MPPFALPPLPPIRPLPPLRPIQPQPGAGSSRPKRSSVQIVLLIVGVSLVAVAAIFFLTVAWLFAGLESRSVIVALFTAAALATAAILRRRRLVATAEGIGTLAVVLVLLDVWALRENNMFELAAVDGPTYWGVALLVCTALFLVWHALSKLRVASVAGFAAVAPGLGLLLAGLASEQEGATRVFLAFLGAAVGTLIHRYTVPNQSRFWPSINRAPERITLLTLGGISLVTAAVAAMSVEPHDQWAPLWSLGGVAIVAFLQVVALLAKAPPEVVGYRAFAYGCAALAALAATLIAPILAIRQESVTLVLTAPIVAAVALALGLESIARRQTVGPSRTSTVVAAMTAALQAATSAIVVIAFAAAPLGQAMFAGLTGAGDPVATPEADNGWALGALVAVVALSTISWKLGGVLNARRRWVAWFALVVIVVAVPFIGVLWLVLASYLFLGALSLIGLLLARYGRLVLSRYRPLVLTLLVTTEAIGYFIGWASSDTWWIASMSAILVAFFARLLVDRTRGGTDRGALLSFAIVLTLILAGYAPAALTLGVNPSGTANLINVVGGLTLAVAVLQVAIALPWRRGFVTAERRFAFWTLFVPTVIFFAIPVTALFARLTTIERETLLQQEPVATFARIAVLLTATLLWIFLRGNKTVLGSVRFVAAIALAPVLLLLTSSIARAVDAPSFVDTITGPTIALIVCALALFVGVVQNQARERIALEIGAALSIVPVVIHAFLSGAPLNWLTFIVAGVVALVVGIAPDGLFASRSSRRHFGWLAIVFATAGLWRGLAQSGSEALEAYVLPVAGLLLIVAALIRRFGRMDRTTTASPVAALLSLAGLLVATLPIALIAQTGTLVRPLIVGGASAVLLLGASAIRWTAPRSAYLAAAGFAGAIGLFITSIGRTTRVLTDSSGRDVGLEAWLLIPCALVIAAAFLLARQTDAHSLRLRQIASVALVVLAIVEITLAEVAAFDNAELVGIRATLLVLALAAVHAIARWLPRAPLGPVTAWTSFGLAAFAALYAVSLRATDPMELITVPVGLALLAGQLLASRGQTSASPAAGGQLLAVGINVVGLFVAIIPSAFAGADGAVLRPLLTLCLGGALAIGGALLTESPRWSRLAWPALGIGLIAVVVTATGRILPLFSSPLHGPDGRLEAWLLPAALFVIAAGVCVETVAGGARVENRAAAASTPPRPLLGTVLVIAPLLGILFSEIRALDYEALTTVRVILLAWLFSALHLLAFWNNRRPFGRLVSWIAIASAAIAAIAGFAYSSPDPIEIVSGPVAIALLASGLLHLDSTASARSWPWLAPGLFVLLVPSLLLDITESALWRIVGLGVLAVVVILIGAVRKLQAPFVIGAVVALIHAIAQLWPWISIAYGAVPWWLWLGIGGVILIVLAAHYEQRIKNLKSIALRVSALR